MSGDAYEYFGKRPHPGKPLLWLYRHRASSPAVERLVGGEWAPELADDLSLVSRAGLTDMIADGSLQLLPVVPWGELNKDSESIAGCSPRRAETDVTTLVHQDDMVALADGSFQGVEMYFGACTYWYGMPGMGQNVTADVYGLRSTRDVSTALPRVPGRADIPTYYNVESAVFRTGVAARKWMGERMRERFLGEKYATVEEITITHGEPREPFSWMNERLIPWANGIQVARVKAEEERAAKERKREERLLKGPTIKVNNSEFARIIAARRRAKEI